jgi:hypothetical protein
MRLEYRRSEDWQLHDLWELVTDVGARKFLNVKNMKGKWWNMKMIETSPFYLSTACIILLRGELLTNEWVSKSITDADGLLL